MQTMPAAVLDSLWRAAQRPIPRNNERGMERRLARIADEGWAYRSTVSDLVEDGDYRLRRGSVSFDVDQLVTAFGYRFVDVCSRPRKRSTSTSLLEALPAATLAALLCDLDAMGFVTGARRLCELVAPTLDGRSVITSDELTVLWSGRTIDRRSVRYESDARTETSEYDEGRLPTGHRYAAALDADGRPQWIEIKGPRHRNTPPPSLRICGTCGTQYMHGDPDSSASHRKHHRRVVRVLTPQPNPGLAELLASGADADTVTSASPAWMHREMYERAFAFKREMGYDFIQWSGERREADPDARGHLIAGPDGTIHGACAFRLRRHGNDRRWGLQWIWIRPEARRSGLLSARWADLRARYGDFHVEGPVSEAMQAFLARAGDAHLMK